MRNSFLLYNCTRDSIIEGESYRIFWDQKLITDTEERQCVTDTESIYNPKN